MSRSGVEIESPVMPVKTPHIRLRRLRHHSTLRELVAENRLSVADCVLPLFIKEGQGIKIPITSMPGHCQMSVDQLPDEIKSIEDLCIPAVILFGIPNDKDAIGSHALRTDSVIAQAVQKIKSVSPHLLVIADVCLCEYTDHGHCGLIAAPRDSGQSAIIDNDPTLPLLAKQAVMLAQAGVDVIAPSGMMDGAVRAIRDALDRAGFTDVPILSYAVKYASAFYGPFREAAEGAPQFGDRRSYQMNPANASMGLREAELDVEEGADMLMVKPAQNYLDVIFRIKQKFPALPLAAYQVSGEFAMIKAAAERGWLDERAAMLESLLSIKRAGADFIITYFAKEFAMSS